MRQTDEQIGKIVYTSSHGPRPYHPQLLSDQPEAQMAALVVVLEGKETSYELKQGQNLIGRLPDSPIPITQGTVSGRHADPSSRARVCVGGCRQPQRDLVNQQRVEGRVELRMARSDLAMPRLVRQSAAAAVGESLPAKEPSVQAQGI